ncbi:hypothetical protein KCU73_g3336, partial [Aureobasidium melanogenum]
MELPVRLSKEKQDDDQHQSAQQSIHMMSKKSEVSDHEKQRELEARYKALEEEEKEGQLELESIEYLERTFTLEGLMSDSAEMMGLIKHSIYHKAGLAVIKRFADYLKFGSVDNEGRLEARLKANLKELDVAVGEIVAAFNKHLPPSHPLHDAVIKAIITHAHSHIPLIANRAEIVKAMNSEDWDCFKVMKLFEK